MRPGGSALHARHKVAAEGGTDTPAKKRKGGRQLGLVAASLAGDDDAERAAAAAAAERKQGREPFLWVLGAAVNFVAFWFPSTSRSTAARQNTGFSLKQTALDY